MTDNQIGAQPRLFIPGLGPLYQRLEPYTWPLVRATAGLMLVPHGWGKLFTEGAVEGLAGGLTKLGLEPAYPLALYIALLELFGGQCGVCGRAGNSIQLSPTPRNTPNTERRNTRHPVGTLRWSGSPYHAGQGV